MSDKSISHNNNDELDDNSDDDDDNVDHLKIVLPSPTKKNLETCLEKSEEALIQILEEKIDKNLEEKAAKTHLNAINVKSLLKEVVTNEHVLALFTEDVQPVYEPKLTRAKAKELLSTAPLIPVPPVTWTTSPKKSDVEILLKEELQEESDDEYIPDESDDNDTSFVSTDSLPPSTPPSVPQEPKIYSEDGLFKVPPPIKTNDTKIAYRTRSKINLSSTPLEVIEKAFVPPEIDLEAYKIDANDPKFKNEEPEGEVDQDWLDFLTKFTQPLDEVAKPSEDEEQDPEYNILADEEIVNIDKEELSEELRMDKAVKISKKELNNLIAELFDYVHLWKNPDQEEQENNEKMEWNGGSRVYCEENQDQFHIRKEEITLKDDIDAEQESDLEEDDDMNFFASYQITLLEQQMRQHVQILTQNFLLTYQHPEIHEYSTTYKEYLMNLKFLSEGKERSMFCPRNLSGALNLMENWEKIMNNDNDERVKETKNHINETMAKSTQCKQTGTSYIMTFPKLILETVSKSDVFLYPSLLPKIPFKSPRLFSQKVTTFTNSEDMLIALGLDQFTPDYVNKKDVTSTGQIKLMVACSYINKHILVHQEARQIKNHIVMCKQHRCATNPIKYYFMHKKAPVVVHYFIPMDDFNTLAPCQRQPSELPYQWRNYIYPITASPIVNITPVVLSPVFTPKVPQGTFVATQPLIKPPLLLPKGPLKHALNRSTIVNNNKRSSTLRFARKPTFFKEKRIDPLTKFVELFSCEGSTNLRNFFELFEEVEQTENMLPNMPGLGAPVVEKTEKVEKSATKMPLDFSMVEIFSSSVSAGSGDEAGSNCASIGQKKDNMEDINTFNKACLNLKPAARKEPSGAEKKKAKIRREFINNLITTAPEDPKEEKKRNEMFALQYYDKMREILDIEDYRNVLIILNDFEGNDVIELYKKVEKILRPKYEELADEFLLFLREKEAAQLDRLIPWIRMQNRDKFLRKLEVYFKDQPMQLTKIYKMLTEFSQDVNVSMEQIKNTLLPMFKGCPVLHDLFLQNFLDERPPQSLLEGPYENFVLNKELSKPEGEETYETITVTDCGDKYGNLNCVCSCHEIEDPEFKSRLRHCIPCGTKFVNGKVYIQSGKGLRPATISFITNPNLDHNIRLSPKTDNIISIKKKKVGSKEDTTSNKKGKPQVVGTKLKESKDTSKTKNSTTKKEHDDTKTKSTYRKRSNSVKKSRIKSKDNKKKQDVVIKSEEEEDCEKILSKPGSNPGQQKRFLDESMENEDNNSNNVKIPSPELEQQTAESESEFCEESSQDICGEESDTNSSASSRGVEKFQSEEGSWKREEDKIILETFQRENDKVTAFKLIAKQLKDRSVNQIKNRFETLMKILMQTLGND